MQFQFLVTQEIVSFTNGRCLFLEFYVISVMQHIQMSADYWII